MDSIGEDTTYRVAAEYMRPVASHDGTRTDHVHYQTFLRAGHIEDREVVLMDRYLFEEFVDELSNARRAQVREA